MAREFGFRFKDVNKKGTGIKDTAAFSSEAAIRYGNFLTHKLAKDYGLTIEQAQALLWFHSKQNLSPKKDAKANPNWDGSAPSMFRYAAPEVAIAKATINIGVGEAGEQLARAEKLLESITNQKPVRTFSKITNPEFGIRKGQPVAFQVTLRNQMAHDAVKMVLDGVGNKLRARQFDRNGNVSFGIEEHKDGVDEEEPRQERGEATARGPWRWRAASPSQ